MQHVQGIPLIGLSEFDEKTQKYVATKLQPEITPDHIYFNGFGGDAHEDFAIYRKRQPVESWQGPGDRGRDFCKTAQKPYDLAVTAVLCYLATVRETHRVSSDGDGHDWLAGLQCARRALPRYANTLDIPRPILEEDRWQSWPFRPRLEVDGFTASACIDGRAYVINERTKQSYCFADHDSWAAWGKANIHILAPSGWLDAKRIAQVARAQKELLTKLLKSYRREEEGKVSSKHKPPLYVRPKAMPGVEKSQADRLDIFDLCLEEAY